MGFSFWWLLLSQSMALGLEGLSNCGTQAELLSGMWNLPGSGIRPVSPALAGWLTTTGPPVESSDLVFRGWGQESAF